jgi:hypothetical protein
MSSRTSRSTFINKTGGFVGGLVELELVGGLVGGLELVDELDVTLKEREKRQGFGPSRGGSPGAGLSFP